MDGSSERVGQREGYEHHHRQLQSRLSPGGRRIARVDERAVDQSASGHREHDGGVQGIDELQSVRIPGHRS